MQPILPPNGDNNRNNLTFGFWEQHHKVVYRVLGYHNHKTRDKMYLRRLKDTEAALLLNFQLEQEQNMYF